MKKMTFITAALAVFIALSACKKDDPPADPPAPENHLTVEWVKYYSYTNYTFLQLLIKDPNCFITNPDGTSVMFFISYDVITGEEKNVILKVDAAGNTVSTKEFPVNGAPGWDVLRASILPTNDNGYLLYWLYGQNTNAYSAIAKTDADGNVIWEKNLDFMPYMRVYGVTEKPAGGYFAFGTSADSCSFILSLNAQGDTLGTRILSNTFYLAYQAVMVSENYYLLGGHRMNINGKVLGKVMAADSNANTIWACQDIYSGLSPETVFVTSMCKNSDQSATVTGYYGDLLNGTAPGSILIKVSDGNVIIDKRLTELPHGCDDIIETDGGYLLITNLEKQIAYCDGSGTPVWIEGFSDTGIDGITIKKSGAAYLLFGFLYDQFNTATSPVLVKFNIN